MHPHAFPYFSSRISAPAYPQTHSSHFHVLFWRINQFKSDRHKHNVMLTRRYKHALKNSMNFGISLADSTVFIFLPCFSEMFCKSSLAPILQQWQQQTKQDYAKTRANVRVLKIYKLGKLKNIFHLIVIIA